MHVKDFNYTCQKMTCHKQKGFIGLHLQKQDFNVANSHKDAMLRFVQSFYCSMFIPMKPQPYSHQGDKSVSAPMTKRTLGSRKTGNWEMKHLSYWEQWDETKKSNANQAFAPGRKKKQRSSLSHCTSRATAVILFAFKCHKHLCKKHSGMLPICW